jgi:RNA polymerase-binding transcription factor DksA
VTEKQTDKEKLIVKRNELREKLESIEKDYRRGLDPDSEERAVQLENAEVLDGIAKAASEELARIEEELARLS